MLLMIGVRLTIGEAVAIAAREAARAKMEKRIVIVEVQGY